MSNTALKAIESAIKELNVKEMAATIGLLRKAMYDQSKVKVHNSSISTYVKDSLTTAIKHGKIGDYPEDFSAASRSAAYKNDIQAAVKEAAESLQIDCTTELLQLAWNNCEKSRTLVDFRKNLKMYLAILKEQTYTPEDIKWYVNEINNLEIQVQELNELKRQNNTLFEVYEKDDEDLAIMMKYRKMKREGLKDIETYAVLGITKDKLKALKKKFVFEE